MLPYLPVHLRFLLKKPGVLVRQDFVLPAQVSRLRRDILPVSVNVFSRFLTSTDGRPASSWSSLLRGHSITNPIKMHYEEIPQNYYTFDSKQKWVIYWPLLLGIEMDWRCQTFFVPHWIFWWLQFAPAEAVLGRPSMELSYELVTLGLCSCQALLPSASATGLI